MVLEAKGHFRKSVLRCRISSRRTLPTLPRGFGVLKDPVTRPAARRISIRRGEREQDMQDRTSSLNIKSLAKDFPGQVVLVLQGGGALGSYQAGVYQALHEAGVEPNWIIGTSIGAINASLIAGNPV